MTDNDIIVEAWNTVLFDKFTRFRHLLIDGLSQHSAAIFDRVPFQPRDRVLDIGCGFGDSTIHIAQHFVPQGEAIGVDCAANFIDVARSDAGAAGVTNATFLVGDAQAQPLGGPYDHAFARFGTMFFSLPGAAMRNIRKSLRPGGTFTQIVWRRREDNPWLHEAELRVKELVPVISHEETNQVHCGPGPFSLAGPDLVSAMMKSAGFNRINFERHDCDICIGRDIDDAIEFAMALGPAGEIIRLAGEIGQQRRPQVMAALQDAFRSYQRKDGTIWAPSSTWFITARNAA